MKREFWVRTISVLMILIFFSACSTMMTVNAIDPVGRPIHDATVLVDGQFIGLTPDTSIRVSNFIATSTDIRIIAEGYHPRTAEPVRELKVGAFIAGIFIWPVLLWVWGPRAQQNIFLTPQAD